MGTLSSQALTLRAHAKVNLCLSIGYPPHDGYHDVRSVFQELDLHDVVRVSIVEGRDDGALLTPLGTHVVLTCDVDGLPPCDNLVFRALAEAERATGVPVAESGSTVTIDVEKRIPAGGGLGGGSSDAAAMLRAFARLTGIDEHDERLCAVARELGADVAFFLHGGTALMGGRGDMFEERLPPLDAPIVLMGDSGGLSTADVYRAFDESPVPAPDADALADVLRHDPRDLGRVARHCANNLGTAAYGLDSRIKERIDAALDHPDVLNALVSGSGSTSFAICPDEAAARRFARAIAPLCGWVRISRVPPFVA